MVRAITIESSEKVLVQATSTSSTPHTNPGIYRLISTHRCHINVGETAIQDKDLYLAVDEEIYVSVPANESIHVIRAAGETDGSLFVTRIRET